MPGMRSATSCADLSGVGHQPSFLRQASDGWRKSWSHGPSHWGDLKPDFAECKNGHRQSPIDIRNPQKADLPPIQFHYTPSPLHIIDNGHTVMINYGPGSSISVGGKEYALKQFHFHRPSEEKINGKGFEMVAHLVHQGSDGNLAVVAVLLQKGNDNPLVHELWNDLPKEKEKEEVLNSVEIDLSTLLPADRGYYTFPGSLTTPPCGLQRNCCQWRTHSKPHSFVVRRCPCLTRRCLAWR